MSSKGAPYKIDYHRYVIFPFINYIISWGVGGVCQKMTQDDKGGGVGAWIGPKKDDVIYEQPLKA